MHKVVFLRHGQSVWNKDNLFTGWVDVGLSQKGKKEAKEAGVLIKKAGFKFDLAFCSVLKRAKQTLKIVLKELSQTNLPQEFAWQLNERHYGALQGRNKKETVKKFGEEQTQIWRRSFKTKPPQLKKTDKLYPGMTESQLPLSESLEDTFNRVIPYWQKCILPEIKAGKKVLVAAHGSAARAFVKYFDDISDKDIEDINIPTGIPLVYQFDENLKPQKRYYLASKAKVEEAVKKVAQESKI